MMVVVTFVSLMVHIYTIGYMADDPGYQRFFAYISLFTFSMLMLVMANNFLQLFFGWEAVGLVSYLLIGFWYTRESAIYANLKAFLVNRVGDFGFILGIALVLAHFGTLDYGTVFEKAKAMQGEMTLICILLFIGAMGKSAQFPLHVWLPDSMEGPTPISALIHAATMVTAGIFMVARMSPLYELSETARSVVLVIGAITALFMAPGRADAVRHQARGRLFDAVAARLHDRGARRLGLLGGMFHLMTHAFFKAVLFLAAGSVIIALHHEQDMRTMGGLRKYMPITYWTMLIGAISSAGIPGFAGFFSKDAIIEAMQRVAIRRARSSRTSAWCRACSSPPCYTFRMVFMAFHGESRFDASHPPHESPAVVTVPLMLLAIPSVVAGYAIGPRSFTATSSAASRCRRPKANYHGVCRLHAARLRVAPVLAGGRRHRHGLVLVLEEDRPAEARGKGPAVRSTRWWSASTASTSSTRGCSPAGRAASARGSGAAATRP